MMSKSRPRPDDTPKPLGRKRRLRQVLQRQWMERELQFFPQPDPPQYKPLG